MNQAADNRPLERICFRLQVDPEQLDDYRAAHAEVWAEMLEALAACGWQNYSLFLDTDGTLIGYFETPSFDDAIQGMSTQPVNDRWQEAMQKYFVGLDQPADRGIVPIEEVFNLETQLAAIGPNEPTPEQETR